MNNMDLAGPYLPEKKMPSTQAKATSLSANVLVLHVDVSVGYPHVYR